VAEYSFYPGCTAHSTGLEYSLSLHAVAHALEIELNEIDDWNCCGGAAARSISNLLGPGRCRRETSPRHRNATSLWPSHALAVSTQSSGLRMPCPTIRR